MVMCEWTLADVKNRASNKAFAKITILGFDIERLKKDIRTNNTGSVSRNELIQVLNGTKKELTTWQYIAELIEKNN